MLKTLKFLTCAAILLLTMECAHAQDAINASVAAATGSVNLTTEGTSDWSHYGQNNAASFDHKALGGYQISPATISAVYADRFTDNAVSFNWSDGAPTASNGGTVNGVFAVNGTFTISVYADASPRTLKVYVGGYQSSGAFTASLSDDASGAATYVDNSASSAGLGNTDGNHYYAVYTLTYQAASAGQTLTISWGQTSQTGNVTLVAATLSGAKPPLPDAPVLTASAGSKRVHLSWSAASSASAYNVKRLSGGAYTTIGTTNGTSYDDVTGLVNGAAYTYVVSGVNLTGEGPNSNAATATPQAGIDGTGLTGEYHRGDNNGNPPFDAGSIILTEVDPGINFNADGSRPVGVPHDNISVKWTGSVHAPVDGDYVFSTNADDGIRLYFDGNLVIDNYSYQAATFKSSGPQTLTAGSLHTIEVDYFQGGGGGIAQLFWEYPGQTLQIIPSFALFPNLPQAAPANPTGLIAFAGDNAVTLTWNTSFNADAYKIKRSLNRAGPFSTLTTVPATLYTATNSYTDSTALNNTRYYYEVSASNGYGESGNSNVASAYPNGLSLVLKYTFEDGPGASGNNTTVTDVTGNGYNGAFSSPGGFVADPANGAYAGATDAGSFRYFTPGISSLNDQFTIFTYFKLPNDNPANPISNIQTIVANAAGGQSSGFKLFVNNFQATDHAVILEARNGTNYGGFATPSGAFPADGKFHAVALSVDKTTGSAQIYVDGVQKASVSNLLSTFSLSTGQIQVGVFPGGAFITSAEYDDFQIFGRNLTAAEIASLSASGATVTGKIALEGVANLGAIHPAAPLGTFHVSLRQNGTEVKAADVTLTISAGSNAGTFTLPGIATGTYDLWIKGSKNLAVLTSGVVVSANGGSVGTTTSPITLPAADSNNDNSVDSSDFTALIGAFNSDAAVAGSGYDAKADFNFDGFVDSSDFTLLIGQFNNVGAN